MQVGKFLKNIKRADPNKAMQGGFFFSKLINVQGKYPYKRRKINVQGDFFLKNNKRAGPNKAVQGEFFPQN